MIFALLLTITADIERIAKRIDSVVGVAAANLRTGESVNVRSSERFPMGSVYKLPIGLEVLRQADAGKIELARKITIREFSPGHSPIRAAAKGRPVTMTVRALVEAMVRDSDNTACDALLTIVTPAAVTKRMRELGAEAVRIDRTEKKIAADIREHGAAHYANDSRDSATPQAMVTLLSKIARKQDGLSSRSHELLMRLMIESRRNRIKEELPKNLLVAHKSGQMPGTRNDTAIVQSPDGTIIVIAIFTKEGVTSDEDVRGEVISAIAKRLYEELK
jgi:beta-lactamase class A